MEKKKICYVVTVPLTIRAFFIPQLKYLADNGFDVSVICTDDGQIGTELGDAITYIPVKIPRGIYVKESLRAIRELKRIFKREKYDLVQYSTPNAAFYASVAAKAARCKVRNYHLMGYRYLGASGIGRRLLKIIEKITCVNSTQIECVSRSNYEMGVSERLFKRDKANVVWNGSSGGVDLARFDYSRREVWRREIRTELGLETDDFVYGFVGRITRDKGINELLEAFAGLKNGTKLLIVGPAEDLKSLDSDLLEKARNSPDIRFHDFVPDIERYYAAIDVLVLPSYREGLGNVVIEAGAVGTPAIVSNIPGPVDVIDNGKTALVVKAKDTVDLADKMKAIRNADYEEMGRAAHSFVSERFDSEIFCEIILERRKQL